MHLSTIIIGDEAKSRPRFANCQTFDIRLTDKCLFNSPEVLALNRKREEARRAQSVACARAFDSTT